jgi:hypothetical protein
MAQVAWLVAAIIAGLLLIRQLFRTWKPGKHAAVARRIRPAGSPARIESGPEAEPAIPPAEYREFDDAAFDRWLAEKNLKNTNLSPKRLFELRQEFLGS